jgi:hypothetical protein
MLHTQCIYLFHVIRRINIDFVPRKDHYPVDLYNADVLCFL